MMMDWLRQRAARSGERAALLFEGRRWTFRELDEGVERVAARVREERIAQGAKVGVLMQNSAEYVMLVHAVARVGAVLVPFNTRLTAEEIAWQADKIGAARLVFDAANESAANEVARKVGRLRLIRAEGLDAKTQERTPIDAEREQLPPDEAYSILFTSGTTGKPKGAVLTYGNHWANAIASALNLGLYEHDVWLACMPLFHVGGLAILLRSVIYGHPVVLHRTFDAEMVNRALDEQGVTIVSLVSTMLARVIEARGARPFPSSLRCVLLGGGPAPRELLERCAALQVPVVQTYGLTEAASQVATLAPEDALRKLGSAGKPLMGVDLRIEKHAGTDAVGEILIRGATVMREYADEPEATARAFREGWFHTGDLGYLDDEGYLYVVSRRDDLIVSGGENVYPAEVEAVLNQHPAVQESAVIGVTDAEWGQAPVAFVVAREGMQVDEMELIAWSAERLAKFKLPKRVLQVESLPRNAAGKLLRRVLLEQWESENARKDKPK